MMKSDKLLTRLVALLLCLPLLLTAALSFSAMALGEVIDPETYDGQVILEDPELIGNIEDDMSKVMDIPVSDAPTDTPTDAPTGVPTNAPTNAPTDAPTDAPTNPPTQAPTEPPAASYEIVMEAPSGWYANRAAMEVTVKDLGGTGWANIHILMDSTTLIDGALPSGHLWLDLLDNCTVKVIVNDPYGAEHEKSVTVSCFDKERPSLKAAVKGEYLHIEASDAQSGVAAVQVNGTTYTDLSKGSLDIHLRQYADAYEQLLVQAVDKVGNVSKAIAVANPFFHNAPTSAPKPTNTPKPNKKPTGGSNSDSGSGNNSGGNASGNSGSGQATQTPIATPVATATVLPTFIPTYAPTTIEAGYPFSDGGNAFTRDLLYDKFTNKQFIAIETRGGDVFYMVIDYDKPLDDKGERYETYFLNLVDNRDLLDIVGESEIKEPEIVYVTPEPTAVPTQAPVAEAPQKKNDGGAMLGIVGLLAIAGGGALWYFKLRTPKNGQHNEPDYDFDDDDENDEEAENEDE